VARVWNDDVGREAENPHVRPTPATAGKLWGIRVVRDTLAVGFPLLAGISFYSGRVEFRSEYVHTLTHQQERDFIVLDVLQTGIAHNQTVFFC